MLAPPCLQGGHHGRARPLQRGQRLLCTLRLATRSMRLGLRRLQLHLGGRRGQGAGCKRDMEKGQGY